MKPITLFVLSAVALFIVPMGAQAEDSPVNKNGVQGGGNKEVRKVLPGKAAIPKQAVKKQGKRKGKKWDQMTRAEKLAFIHREFGQNAQKWNDEWSGLSDDEKIDKCDKRIKARKAKEAAQRAARKGK